MQHIETKYGTLSFENIVREFAYAEGELALVETTLAAVKSMAQQFGVASKQQTLLEQAMAAVASTKALLQQAQQTFAQSAEQEQQRATDAT